MSIFVTGGSGFLGRAFTKKMIEKGETVYSLSRHPVPGERKLIGLRGDILQPNLGLTDVPGGITSVYHLAGKVSLGEDRDKTVWETNFTGTNNVIEFCHTYELNHLYYCSTAYSKFRRNPYEKSKDDAEDVVRTSKIPYTIFRPSIVVAITDEVKDQHIPEFARIMMKVHRRADLVRRRIEGSLHLPVLEPVFHFRGNPDGELNLISLEDVIDFMSTITQSGEFNLTNPQAPTVQQVASAIGQMILLNVQVSTEFNETPIEFAFARLTKSFAPYLKGNHLDSDLTSCAKIDDEFVHKMLKSTLL
jgi:nucleoside-diphosphate-sugar epimerase